MIKELFDSKITTNDKGQFILNEDIVLEILNKYETLPALKSDHQTNFHYKWHNFKKLQDYQKKSFAEQIFSAVFREFRIKKTIKSLSFLENCFACGEYFEFEISETEYKEINPKSCFTQMIHKRQIEFKTGNLVMADYFRFKPYSLLDLVKDDNSIDLNCAKGQLKETDKYLHHNFVKVQVGNSSPSVIKKGNNLFFAQTHENDTVDYPSICTDLWAVTLCEKETLVNFLVSQGVSEDDALEEIQETTHVEMKVDSGIYEFEFDVRSHHLEDIPEFSTLYFTLKKID